MRFWLLFPAILSPLIGAESLEEDGREVFRRFDENQNGVLEEAEIFGWPWAAFDRDQNGGIVEEEFCRTYGETRNAALSAPNREETFSVFDWNADGRISGLEICVALVPADTNRDGFVLLEEFLAFPGGAAPAPEGIPGLDALNDL